jgi:recombination protein RecT
VWPVKKVWKHRDRYNKVGDRHYSFKHPEMYARKVVLLQVIKYLPSSIELSQAMDMDYAANQGTQHLTNPLEVIEGTYMPVVEDPDEAPEPPVAVPVEAAPPVADSLLPKEPKK